MIYFQQIADMILQEQLVKFGGSIHSHGDTSQAAVFKFWPLSKFMPKPIADIACTSQLYQILAATVGMLVFRSLICVGFGYQ